ncbi:hypothetical protein INT44_002273 [Umbelopsis vinacea]|uniref:Uncharacterized protein n=1 Tax=Umbelopsis vinacea TaxID=44442 RepID=A0A8H7UKW0_9FUNG|nr:hypothetical protein INT44_002273 [Umbelopsis vinacea]
MNAEYLLNNATGNLHNNFFQTNISTKNKRKLDDYDAELSSPKRFTDLTSNAEYQQQLPFPPLSPFDAQHRRSNFYPQDPVASAMPAITYASPDYRPPPPSVSTQAAQFRLGLNLQQQQPTMVQDTDMGDSSGSDEEFGNLPTPAEYVGDSLERGWSQILYGQDQDSW